MIAKTDQKNYTVAEYFDLDLASETRHEYYNGDIIPMIGGTPEHNRISGNLYILLSLFLKRQAYEVFHVDQRLWIPDLKISPILISWSLQHH